ncbi:MAG TPA: hypothetical protein VJL82_09590, partial [Rhizomicrobium sp.]|nr:hypothetical protein [Rhizomicrobium sp.]
ASLGCAQFYRWLYAFINQLSPRDLNRAQGKLLLKRRSPLSHDAEPLEVIAHSVRDASCYVPCHGVDKSAVGFKPATGFEYPAGG